MSEHILFLTGKLAEKQLRQVLADLAPDFQYTVHVLGISVAALMTSEMIRRRLHDTFGATRIIVPGRCRGDLASLSEHLAVPVERGPEEVKDLPEFFGRRKRKPDLSRYAMQIFAEIVDAPRLSVSAILTRAAELRRDGADVIDVGCLPETPFPHLEDCVAALKQQGYRVSVDSLAIDDLRRGERAGADYLLSLNDDTLWLADEISAVPVIIPSVHGDMRTLDEAIAKLRSANRKFIVDPILDPIHFGFIDSLVRYRDIRTRYPDVDIMMGVGNLTELTHADTAGINATLLGICSELRIDYLLTTQVSPHARRAVKEADAARRIMFAARELNTLPKHLDDRLLALHETKPFLYNPSEIAELAAAIRDPSFRILTSADGIHVFNRDGLRTGTDPFELYPQLGVEQDAGHAFYLGVELARAQLSWQLGKRYVQDEPLAWGVAAEAPGEIADLHHYKSVGSTLGKQPPKDDALPAT